MGKDRNIVRLTEADLTRMVAEAVQEKFNRQSMKDAVKAGGGVDADDWNMKYDARSRSNRYDLADAEAGGRIPKEVINALYAAGIAWNEPLNNQILVCRDGSAIVVADPFRYDSGYASKRDARHGNWLDDKGSKPDGAVPTAVDVADRRNARREERGVKKARGAKPQPGEK